MTPKEKANELFNKYVELSGIFIGDYESEKEMCLILINEVLDNLEDHTGKDIKFWQEVKQEINKL